MADVIQVLKPMTVAEKELPKRIETRTAQFERIKGKDSKSLQTVKYVGDRAGEDMQSFVSKMDADIPRFASAYATALNSYAKATLMLPDFDRRRYR